MMYPFPNVNLNQATFLIATYLNDDRYVQSKTWQDPQNGTEV